MRPRQSSRDMRWPANWRISDMKYVLSCLLVGMAMTVFVADANAVVCARCLPSGLRGTTRRGGCASSGSRLRMG
jgi:hypothetical protein